MTRTPTGAVHEVPVDDLFFSTTDAKGVITEANEVFTRNARFSREQLLGSPHNIIRHPDMPGAVFLAMWTMLAAGEPVCAYVKNLAADGSTYRAFATVVPIGDRFLSVRSRPCNTEARDLVEALYADVRAFELAARADGVSSHEAATLGAEQLANALRANGFVSYADFQLDLVPAEVAAREELCSSLPDLADRDDVAGPLRTMLTCATDLRDQLGAFAGDLEESLEVGADLGRDVRRLTSALTAVASTMRRADAVERGERRTDEHIVMSALTRQVRDAVEQARIVTDELAPVLRHRAQLRLASAVARLQAEAVGRYVVAVADGREDPRASERALVSVAEALLSLLDADLARDAEATGRYAARVEDLALSVRGVLELVGSWSDLLGAGVEQGDDVLRDAFRELRVALDGLARQTDRVRGGIHRFTTTAALDRDRLAGTLGEVTRLAAGVQDPAAAGVVASG